MSAFAHVLGPDVRYEPVKDDRHRSAAAWPALKAWLEYMALAGNAARTLDAYERVCAVLLREFPYLRFEEFTDAELMTVLLSFPPKSRLTNKSPLMGWFKWGYRQRRIPADPSALLPGIKYRAPEVMDVFTSAEVTALCGLPFPDGDLMTILLWTGIRRAEACHLTAKRFDFKSGKLLVREGAKGSKDREMRMLPVVVGAADRLITTEGLNPDEFLWYNRPGGRARHVKRDKPLPTTSYQLWWRRGIEAAGVRYLKPHTTRHTYARHLREIGVPLEDIQFVLGHEKIETTLVYAKSTADAVGARILERVMSA